MSRHGRVPSKVPKFYSNKTNSSVVQVGGATPLFGGRRAEGQSVVVGWMAFRAWASAARDYRSSVEDSRLLSCPCWTESGAIGVAALWGRRAASQISVACFL